jgi:transcriptional regulator with XRE-family HTH domain
MPRTRIDVRALYAALDAARRSKDRGELSWRQLAGMVGVSPSTMSRLANGHRPDVDAFVALVRWLGIPAERFMIDDDEDDPQATEPELLAELAPLLRARHDLNAEDVEYLEDLIRAAVRRFAAERTPRAR